MIFNFFSALDDESTMVRVSAWIILLVKQASHMKEKRRGNVSSGSEKHGSSSSDSSSTSAGPKKKGKGVMGNKAKKEEGQGLYNVAGILLEFLLEKGIVGVVSGVKKEGEASRLKGGSYAIKSSYYLEPIFALYSIPRISNFPMVCKPLPWSVTDHRKGATIMRGIAPTDLKGGYLNPG